MYIHLLIRYETLRFVKLNNNYIIIMAYVCNYRIILCCIYIIDTTCNFYAFHAEFSHNNKLLKRRVIH